MADDMNQGNTPQNSQYVAFNLRDEEYGVSILNVQEIRNLTDITRVPFAADFIKGVINLRGSVLPVIDLKQRLGLAETPYTDRTRIVTVSVEDVHVGMLHLFCGWVYNVFSVHACHSYLRDWTFEWNI